MTDLPEMPCRELVERVTEYLEGLMPAADRARLEAHLGECDPCTVYLEQLRETLALTGRLREDDLPPQLRDELLRAFRAKP